MNPYEDKLARMLADGKITQEQYNELRENLPPTAPAKPGANDGIRSDSPLRSIIPGSIPLPIAICAAYLFFAAFIRLSKLSGVSFVSLNSEGQSILIGDVINVALGIALLKMRRWAYVALLILALPTLISELFTLHLAGLVLNSLYYYLLVSAWPFFFADKTLSDLINSAARFYLQNPSGKLYAASPLAVKILRLLFFFSMIVNLCGGYGARMIVMINMQLGQAMPFLQRLIVHSFANIRPAAGVAGAVLNALMVLAVVYPNRTLYKVLGAILGLGLLGSLVRFDLFTIMMKLAEAGLLYLAWRAMGKNENWVIRDAVPQAAP